MNSLLLLPLLLAAMPQAEAPIDARHPEAIQLYHCDFSQNFDLNYDEWPDQWTRRGGVGFPRYLDIKVTEEDSAVGDRSLKMSLDGGSAAIYSPPIEAREIFSYVLEARMRTEGLKYDKAFLSITFFDAKEQPIETFYSERFRETGGWIKLRVGPVAPVSTDVAMAVIGLHIEPAGKIDEDLTGAVFFDDIWFARLPKMTLATPDGTHVFSDPSNIDIICEVSGIVERDPRIVFELVDVGRQSLAKMESRLNGKVVARKSNLASELFGKQAQATVNWDIGYAGKMDWKPPITQYGFYEIHATMIGSTGLMHRRVISVAVVPDELPPSTGEFGWSLRDGEAPLDMTNMGNLLTKVGVNWVKFPVWYGENQKERANEVARFAERLKKNHIEMIALVDKPPEDIRYLFGENDNLLVASIFAEPILWRPYLEPVMTRLSLKVRYWQLGSDEDVSFVGYRNLLEKLEQIHAELRKSGQDIRLGVPWRWMAETPSARKLPWEFLAYSIIPQNGDVNDVIPLTKDELGSYLDSSKGPTQRFVTIYPLARSKYTTNERARDLLEKMLSAKIHHAEAVFIPRPFDHEYGVMNEDGSPSELLLPWRTTAQMISGATYLGQLQLPNDSNNHVFTRDGSTTMVIWNDRPVTETIYLGDDVEVVDLWGRRVKPTQDEHRQVIEVGPIPMFIVGMNESVAKMRMSCQFDPAVLSSNFGIPQRLKLSTKNEFPQSLSGVVRIVGPDVWEITPDVTPFKLSLGGEYANMLSILLRNDASSGYQRVRLDFEIEADKTYKFSVYRRILIGSGMLNVESSCHLDEATGDLVIEAELLKQDDDFSTFDCMLFAPGRKRMQTRVTNMSRGRKTVTYRIPNGADLLGTNLLLQIREIGGVRIFNHRVVAAP
ncbi:hypothetical protein LOC68_15400 [Blastopirellula sp. JC732]|uniref:Glycoside hydrolase family 42 N-terminal domain-containing protein n=1 Tax=Blastopirellula sediminis TaxID=2894196 RepID=A0A9X1MP46_9BACT|nr:hypothetical protein [Blastopirellula sediminis]MCC9606930.1 hypothetical protein [Blastopirellula sediminis]MCC9629775.1 hypothetical protein [Blastopirellula sediminis]